MQIRTNFEGKLNLVGKKGLRSLADGYGDIANIRACWDLHGSDIGIGNRVRLIHISTVIILLYLAGVSASIICNSYGCITRKGNDISISAGINALMIVLRDGEKRVAAVAAEHSAGVAVCWTIDAIFERIEIVSPIRTCSTGIIGVVVVSMAKDAIGSRRAGHAYGQTRKTYFIIHIVSTWTGDAVVGKASLATRAIRPTVQVHIAFGCDSVHDVTRQAVHALRHCAVFAELKSIGAFGACIYDQ